MLSSITVTFLLQYMSYHLLAEMEQEHCHMTGCNAPFECCLHYESKDGNLKPTTTAKQEWDYVVNNKPPSYLEEFKLKEMYKERKANRYWDWKPEQDTLKHELSGAERLGLALYTGPMVCHFVARCCLKFDSECSTKFTTTSCAGVL
jgi:hypothetical protein